MNETEASVTITVEDFRVTSPSGDSDERRSECRLAARDIASDINAALASCGTSAIQGRVTVTIDDVVGASDE